MKEKGHSDALLQIQHSASLRPAWVAQQQKKEEEEQKEEEGEEQEEEEGEEQQEERGKDEQEFYFYQCIIVTNKKIILQTSDFSLQQIYSSSRNFNLPAR